MQRYSNYSRQYGSATPAPGCTIEVYLTGTLTLATIFADNEDPPTAKGNPFTSDPDGYFYFYAEAGRYDVRISGVGVTTPYVWADLLLIDGFAVAYTDADEVTFEGGVSLDGDLLVGGSGTFGSGVVPLIGADGRLAGLSATYLADLSGASLTALNASALASGTVPDARLSGSYASPVTLSNPANVLAGASLALGATPASVGALRLTFGEAIYARNQANSGDVALLRLSSDDYAILASASGQHLRPYTDDTYNFGETDRRWRNGHIKDLYLTGPLTLGDPDEAASVGGIRLPNGDGWEILWRNAAGSDNIAGIYAGSDDKLHLDSEITTSKALEPHADDVSDVGTSSLRYKRLFLSTAAVIGTLPATTGAIRLANTDKVVARNAANGADVDLFALDAADWFRVYRKLRYDGPQSTGGDTAGLGTNAPALSSTTPNTWMEVMNAAGERCVFPVWKVT